MVKGKQLASDIKSRIISRHETGISYKNICELLIVSKSTIQSVINKCQEFVSTANLPRLENSLSNGPKDVILFKKNPRTMGEHLLKS